MPPLNLTHHISLFKKTQRKTSKKYIIKKYEVFICKKIYIYKLNMGVAVGVVLLFSLYIYIYIYFFTYKYFIFFNYILLTHHRIVHFPLCQYERLHLSSNDVNFAVEYGGARHYPAVVHGSNITPLLGESIEAHCALQGAL